LSWVVAPEVIPEEAFLAVGVEKDHILRYPGIKEDVYTPFFRPSLAFKSSLGLNGNCVIVTVRPPATEAHYHNPESEVLLAEVMEFLSQHPNVKTVMVPRTPNQEHNLRQAWPAMFADGRAIIPKHVVDGLDLIWSSDLVISGGGTMNREAAALGVPVYSIFRGKLGAVDRYLADTGRLVLLQSIEDIHQKLKIVPRDQDAEIPIAGRNALQKVVDHIVSVLESK
jgi:predicted glycosyltransferase